jgi:hypothetical protein
VLDQQRIGTEQSAIEVGIAQLRALLPQITRPVMVRADRWYAVARFVCACGELGCAALIRLKRNRKLYRAAPPKKPKQRGAPCKHGPLFQGTRPETYGPADAEWEGTDEQGKRFSQEHGYRFLKQDLLWAHAHLRTPQPRGMLELDRGLCLQSVALEQTAGLGRPASVGKHTARSHPSAGASGHALHFAAAWHTGSATQTAWKIARMAQRQAKDPCAALSSGAQTQTRAKNVPETGLMASHSLS